MFRFRVLFVFCPTLLLALYLALFLAFSSETACSAPVEVHGGFESVQQSGIPVGWSIHTWEGYRPFPKIQTIPGPQTSGSQTSGPQTSGSQTSGRALSMTEISGPDGGAIQTQERFPARSGYVGRITCRVRGRGQGWITFYRWGENNEWNGVIPADRFPLSDIWQQQTITIPVDNGHACQTHAVSLAIGAIRSSEIEVADLKVDLEPTEFFGDRPLPSRWQVFAFVPDTALSDEAVKSSTLAQSQVPDVFGGIQGQTLTLMTQKLNLTQLLNETNKTEENKSDENKSDENKSIWLFAQWDAPYEYDTTLAVAWPGTLAGFLNGQKFVDRPNSGFNYVNDGETPVTVRLKKGANLLAFQLRRESADMKSAGMESAVLTLSGPKDLRGATRQLRLTDIWNSEDFDAPTVICSGSPKVIQGNPTPGLLTLSGQGVFQTEKSLTIDFPSGEQTRRRNPSVIQDQNQSVAAGLRIQSFGPAPASFEIQAVETLNKTVLAACRIDSRPDRDQLSFTVSPKSSLKPEQAVKSEQAVKPVTFELAKRILPASITFGLSGSGRWSVYVSSLVDSQSYFRTGTFDTNTFTTGVFGISAVPPATGSPQRVSPIDFQFVLSSVDAQNTVDIQNVTDTQNATSTQNTANTPSTESGQRSIAEITVDNLAIGVAVSETKSASAPFQIDLISEFDPVAAGWKRVFADEFDGDHVDLTRWRHSSSSEPRHAKVHHGLLEISCDWNDRKTNVCSASLYSNQRFGYGYYEARVKFRQQSGWWSAFWLCTHGPSNPFIDGWEIDIYEDYYMGPKTAGQPPRAVLDHNLHVFSTGTLRSWNYNSKLPGSPEDFYVVGCKWTPFEISYYLNGRRIKSEASHSPYDAVTFDPFHHAAGFVPLYAILSGCCGKSGGDPTKGTFPESFFVDYVRIYEFPARDVPKVTLVRKPADEDFIVRPGDTLRFEAQVEPATPDGPKIQTVYLFDSGALLDYRTRPPYVFDIPITKEFYDKTDFARPGRTGIRQDFDRGLHAYCIFAQDEAGNVGHCEPVVRLLRKNGQTRPWQGKPHTIPGEIKLPYYDEGGQGIAYSDGTPGNVFSQDFRPGESVDATPDTIGGISGSEWLKYTIDVRKPGLYTFRFLYGTPEPGQRGPMIMIDNKTVGEFKTPPHEFTDWRTDTIAELKDIPLTAGEHELILLFQGTYNARTLTIEAQ